MTPRHSPPGSSVMFYSSDQSRHLPGGSREPQLPRRGKRRYHRGAPSLPRPLRRGGVTAALRRRSPPAGRSAGRGTRARGWAAARSFPPPHPAPAGHRHAHPPRCSPPLRSLRGAPPAPPPPSPQRRRSACAVRESDDRRCPRSGRRAGAVPRDPSRGRGRGEGAAHAHKGRPKRRAGAEHAQKTARQVYVAGVRWRNGHQPFPQSKGSMRGGEGDEFRNRRMRTALLGDRSPARWGEKKTTSELRQEKTPLYTGRPIRRGQPPKRARDAAVTHPLRRQPRPPLLPPSAPPFTVRPRALLPPP